MTVRSLTCTFTGFSAVLVAIPLALAVLAG
jgi:hypothetical protein